MSPEMPPSREPTPSTPSTRRECLTAPLLLAAAPRRRARPSWLLGAAALGTALAAWGCSREEKREDESYSYSYEVNGCATGRHTLRSKAGYCAALKDEVLNHGCAAEARAAAFERDCR